MACISLCFCAPPTTAPCYVLAGALFAEMALIVLLALLFSCLARLAFRLKTCAGLRLGPVGRRLVMVLSAASKLSACQRSRNFPAASIAFI